MIAPIFAMPFESLAPGVAVAFLVLLVVAAIFLHATDSRTNEQNRRAVLGLLALLGGPVVGTGLAGLAHAFGDLHPMDVRYTYSTFAVIGGIAGFLACLIFALTGLLASNGPKKKPREEPEV